jgi:peptide-methionine (S)-S-oxide reductase
MTEKATFAAGCYWRAEVEFRNIAGVTDVQVGYTGGRAEDATYRDVGGPDGHAEAVEVEFDADEVSYEDLLERFWSMHDVTRGDRSDGERSAVFAHSREQEAAAKASRERAQARFRGRIATQIEPAGPFWRAEEFNQRYWEKRTLATARS